MTKRDKDLDRILDGRHDRSIDFALLVRVLLRLGYTARQRGSHYVFTKSGCPGLVLAAHQALAPSYQVRQVRRAILDHETLEPEQ